MKTLKIDINYGSPAEDISDCMDQTEDNFEAMDEYSDQHYQYAGIFDDLLSYFKEIDYHPEIIPFGTEILFRVEDNIALDLTNKYEFCIMWDEELDDVVDELDEDLDELLEIFEEVE